MTQSNNELTLKLLVLDVKIATYIFYYYYY